MSYPWLMREKEIRIAINPAMNEALERIAKSRCLESPEQCVKEILEVYIAALPGSLVHPAGGFPSETELLRSEIARLEQRLERKEQALSALVDLFEEFVVERDRRGDEETS